MFNTVGVCGYIRTGSSAVLNFLKEFHENIIIDDFEFDFLHFPDAIDDLNYHLHEGSYDLRSSFVAIERFKRLCNSYHMRKMNLLTNNRFLPLTEKYLNDLIQIKYYGKTLADIVLYPKLRNNRMKRSFLRRLLNCIIFFENQLNRQFDIFPFHELNYASFPKDFLSITKKYIEDILIMLMRDGREGNIVLDQLFTCNNPQKYFNYLKNPKAIIVDRDPRDIYLLAKNVRRLKGERGIPTKTVANYVNFFKATRKNRHLIGPDDYDSVLFVQFEDLIYEYEKTSKKIMNFLNLSDPISPKKYFIPEKSITNTQLFGIYKNEKKDIEYIEKELSEYLYPYQNYSHIKMFRSILF
jgi:hypothetical protein